MISILRAPLALSDDGPDPDLLTQDDLEGALDVFLDGELLENITDGRLYFAVTRSQYITERIVEELDRRGKLYRTPNGAPILPWQTDVELDSALTRPKRAQ